MVDPGDCLVYALFECDVGAPIEALAAAGAVERVGVVLAGALGCAVGDIFEAFPHSFGYDFRESFYGYESIGGNVVAFAGGGVLHYLQGCVGDVVEMDEATCGVSSSVQLQALTEFMAENDAWDDSEGLLAGSEYVCGPRPDDWEVVFCAKGFQVDVAGSARGCVGG